ncbi:MAG TPA: AMP-binding protein [Stellaceae bacterium]|nr:AMP-binding protein [Stellaceae bacterium]
MAESDSNWPWLRSYPPGIDWFARFAEEPLHQLLEDSARRFADRPCLDFLGKRYSYAEIGAWARRAAKGFAALGVTRGTRVALMLPNTPYYVVAYYGILAAGGTVVNLNPLYAPPEIHHLVEDSGAEIVLTLDLPAHLGLLTPLLGRASLRDSIAA